MAIITQNRWEKFLTETRKDIELTGQHNLVTKKNNENIIRLFPKFIRELRLYLEPSAGHVNGLRKKVIVLPDADPKMLPIVEAGLRRLVYIRRKDGSLEVKDAKLCLSLEGECFSVLTFHICYKDPDWDPYNVKYYVQRVDNTQVFLLYGIEKIFIALRRAVELTAQTTPIFSYPADNFKKLVATHDTE